MAITPNPLVWNTYRKIDGAQNLGGVVHYYDEESQSLWLSSQSGIKTNVADVPEGHWRESVLSDTITIGTPNYEMLALDHPFNGVLYGVAVIDSKLVYLRYVYGLDCSNLITSGSLSFSNSNSVSQLKANIMNIDEKIFNKELSVFQPGAKVILKFVAGREAPFGMCTVFLDSVDYDSRASTVPISGRNNIGYILMESTFDDNTKFEGTPSEVANQIFALSGVRRYAVGASSITESRAYEFDASQSLMSGIESIGEALGWKMIETPIGAVILGDQNVIKNYAPNGYHIFDEGEIFKRKIKKSSDAAYTRVRVNAQDEEGNDLEPVFAPVKNYTHWSLPVHKTYHVTAPKGLSEQERVAYAQSLADSLQYVGIGEDFNGPTRPQLLIGDVAAEELKDGTIITLGIVTSIKHSFGASGFYTDFTIDSGGVISEAPLTAASNSNSTASGIVTVTRSLSGYNRAQTIKDLIEIASPVGKNGKRGAPGVPGIPGYSPVKGQDYFTPEDKASIVQEVLDQVPGSEGLPDFSADDNGKVLKVQNGTLTWGVDNTGDGGGGGSSGSLVIPGVINYAYEHTTDSDTHSRTYSGKNGNMLLLLIMTRGEIVNEPIGWNKIGILVEDGDKKDGSVSYVQYAHIYSKVCDGQEHIEYSQTQSNKSITCFIEFEGVSGFEVLENTRAENIKSTGTAEDFTCTKTSTRMAIWVANACYFKTEKTSWDISDNNIWAISDNHGIEPRLGVMIDNRIAPKDFTVGASMYDNRNLSFVCIQVVPSGVIS